MIKECEAAGLPRPVYFYDMSGFFVRFKKDIYNEEELREIGLNERQVKAVMYVVETGGITNNEYQKINEVRKTVATLELRSIIEKGILNYSGRKGRGSKYTMANLIGR